MDNNNDMSNTMAMEFGPQPNKPKKKHRGLLTFIIFLLGLIIGGAAVGYFLVCIYNPFEKKEEKEPKTVQKQTPKTENLSSDNYLVKTLLNRLHSNNTSEEIKIYSNNKLDAEDLETEYVNDLMVNEVKRENISTDNIYTKEKMQEALFTIFGEDTAYIVPEEDFGTCPKYTFNSEKKEYNEEKGECSTDTKYSLKTNIVKAIKSDKKIEIYEAVAFLNNEEKKVYKKVDANGELKDELKNINADDFLIERDYKKVNQYKYTFTYNEETSNYIFENLTLVK